MPTPVAQLRAYIDHGTEPNLPRRRVALQLTARIRDPWQQGYLVDVFNEALDQLAIDSATGQAGVSHKAHAHDVLNQILDASGAEERE